MSPGPFRASRTTAALLRGREAKRGSLARPSVKHLPRKHPGGTKPPEVQVRGGPPHETRGGRNASWKSHRLGGRARASACAKTRRWGARDVPLKRYVSAAATRSVRSRWGAGPSSVCVSDGRAHGERIGRVGSREGGRISCARCGISWGRLEVARRASSAGGGEVLLYAVLLVRRYP
ncbi:hypothetical protein GY45DRAFT_978069 [Cubamyces sp. BRFM 1775]|nr:hypothetical protein GY45DRAFT_978069 [Cubamyces sp. BRFM 1775]